MYKYTIYRSMTFLKFLGLLILLNSTNGSPTRDEDDSLESKKFVLADSVVEAIEENITRILEEEGYTYITFNEIIQEAIELSIWENLKDYVPMEDLEKIREKKDQSFHQGEKISPEVQQKASTPSTSYSEANVIDKEVDASKISSFKSNKFVILADSIFKAIEENITRILNKISPVYTTDSENDAQTPHEPSDRTELATPTSELKAKEEESKSLVITNTKFVQKAIELSIRKNLKDYLPERDEDSRKDLENEDELFPISVESASNLSWTTVSKSRRKKEKMPLSREQIDSKNAQLAELENIASSSYSQALQKEKVTAPVQNPWVGRTFVQTLKEASSPEDQPEVATRYIPPSQRRSTTDQSEASRQPQAVYPLLIIPKNSENDAQDELRRCNIKLESFQVVNSRPNNPGGRLRVECLTENARKKLESAIAKCEKLESLIIIPHPYEVRLSVRQEIDADEISSAVLEVFGERPRDIHFIPYKTEPGVVAEFKIALLYVSRALYRQMEKNPNLYIGRIRSKIDTTIRVDRCDNCWLLGHRGVNCRGDRRPRPGPDDKCIDCIKFNNDQRRRYGINVKKLNDVNHTMGDDRCETKKYYTDLWRRNRDNS